LKHFSIVASLNSKNKANPTKPSIKDTKFAINLYFYPAPIVYQIK